MNKKLFINKNDCCGCGVCMNICRCNAIHMEENKDGFLYPVIDAERCVNCDACKMHCPIAFHDNIAIKQHHIENYAAYMKNRHELLQSASGGAATALAKTVLSHGGVVFGVSYTENYKKSKTRKVLTIDELPCIKDSKYMQSDKGTVYKEVKSELEKGKEVLYTGTPCEIGAVKSFLGKDYVNFYTCELICHGPTTYKVAKKYLDEQERIQKSKLVKLSVRNKENGWKVPHIKLEFQNGKSVVSEFYKSDYGTGFVVMLRESCHQCIFKGDGKVADITVGDFWGANEEDPFWNADGISAINIHTEKGKKLLHMTNDLMLFPVSYDRILRGNIYLEASAPYDRATKLFKIGLRLFGLHNTVRLYNWYRNILASYKR